MLMTRFLQPALFGLAVASFSTNTVVADATDLYQAQCSACHSSEGAGNSAMKVPAIAALDVEYLKTQLINYKQGLRGTAPSAMAQPMSAIAKGLSTEQIDSLAEYIAALPLPELQQTVKRTGFRGRGLYSTCISCHGAQGEGYPALKAPRISHQHGWYLEAQLEAFRAGQRGYHAEDVAGKQMRAMADKILSDDDIHTLVHYIMGLK